MGKNYEKDRSDRFIDRRDNIDRCRSYSTPALEIQRAVRSCDHRRSGRADDGILGGKDRNAVFWCDHCRCYTGGDRACIVIEKGKIKTDRSGGGHEERQKQIEKTDDPAFE